jgi:hypothetical protein
VTASRKKPCNHRFCMSSPTKVPTTNASANPIPSRVSVVANAPGTSPLAQRSPKVRKTSVGPGRRFSSISRPDANSQRVRKKA